QQSVIARLESHPEKQKPIVVAHPASYFQLTHYAPPALASRLVYVSDTQLSERFLGHYGMERSIQGIQTLSGVDVRRCDAFVSAQPRFLVYGNGHWLLRALLADGADIRLEAAGVYLVTASARQRNDAVAAHNEEAAPLSSR